MIVNSNYNTESTDTDDLECDDGIITFRMGINMKMAKLLHIHIQILKPQTAPVFVSIFSHKAFMKLYSCIRNECNLCFQDQKISYEQTHPCDTLYFLDHKQLKTNIPATPKVTKTVLSWRDRHNKIVLHG